MTWSCLPKVISQGFDWSLCLSMQVRKIMDTYSASLDFHFSAATSLASTFPIKPYNTWYLNEWSKNSPTWKRNNTPFNQNPTPQKWIYYCTPNMMIFIVTWRLKYIMNSHDNFGSLFVCWFFLIIRVLALPPQPAAVHRERDPRGSASVTLVHSPHRNRGKTWPQHHTRKLTAGTPPKKVPGMFVGVSSWKQLGIVRFHVSFWGVYL